MILFFISAMLVFISSYFLTSYFCGKNSSEGIFYLFISAYANIVLTFEILSLFSCIKIVPVLLLNLLFAFLSFIFWKKSGKALWSLEFKSFLKKYFYAVKSDKSLIVLSLGFITLITVSVFLITPCSSAIWRGLRSPISSFTGLWGGFCSAPSFPAPCS